jgi:hypothetical protein
MDLRLRRLIRSGSIEAVRSTVFLAVFMSAGFATSGCGRDASPTAPAPVPVPPVVAEPPGPSSVTLKGRVTEAVPTTLMGVWDATVTLSDGTASWSSAKTYGGAAQGNYEMTGLRPGRYEAVVAADGYQSVTRTVVLSTDSITDVAMLPVPKTMSDTFEFQISDADGTCSDGTQARPCRICAIPIHTAGPLDATLNWKAAGDAKLNVTLFQAGQPVPLAQSSALNDASRHLAMQLPGGALYELRITYVSGTGPASYTMRVVHQN